MSEDRVGTGRGHGVKPAPGGMERTLYNATHHDTYWENPEPHAVAELIDWYRTLPGCGNGGSLHIAIEDDNLDDAHLDWCLGYAFGIGDTCGAELGGLLRRMSAWDRVHAVVAARDLEAARQGLGG